MPRLHRHRRIVGELCQATDAVAARILAIGQVLRQRQTIDRVIGVVLGQSLNALSGLAPFAVDTSQGLVVLETQAAAGDFTAEQRAIGLHRLLITPLPGEASGFFEFGLIDGALLNRGFDPGNRGVLGMRFLEPLQVDLGRFRLVAARLGHRQTLQRLCVVGLHAQQLEPGFPREIIATAVLPVMRLGNQRLQLGITLGRACNAANSGAHKQSDGQTRQRENTPQHDCSHLVSS